MIAASLAAPLNLVSPYLFHHPAPVAYAGPVHHVAFAAPAIETRVHYADTPVVVGHSAQILKPALAAPIAVAPLAAPAVAVVEAKKEEEKPAEKATEEVKTVHLAYAASAPIAFAAPAVLNLKAPVPAGDAPPMDELVTKQKVLAPVRAISEVVPQVTVQHPTKVNVEKVAVDVPVAAPYALPVPVAVAPHFEIHQVHTPALTVVG